MIDAADSAGTRLFVAENVCYSPMSRTLREIVSTGRHVGEVVGASFVRGFRGVPYGYPGRRSWLSTPQQGGSGHWLLNGIHAVAQIRFIFGEVDTVYMRNYRAASFGRADVEGTMSGTFTMASGCQLSVLQTAEVRLKDPLGGCVIYGDQGSIRAGSNGYEVFGNDVQPERIAYPEETLSSYAEEFEAFADYVAGVAEGPTTGVSERRSLAVVQAGYESAESGQAVNLTERFGDL
jgi:predicted dehydrogenase